MRAGGCGARTVRRARLTWHGGTLAWALSRTRSQAIAMTKLRRLFSWLLALAALVFVAYCGGAGWQLSSGLKQMVTVGGPFTNPPLQTRDPLVLDYDGDPQHAFGWRFESLSIASELGPLPAWIVPPDTGTGSTWMIYTHGMGARREDGYRFLSVARPLGITTLLYSYRNDAGAPPSPDGIYRFGLSEWRDLDAAVETARQRGAKTIILAAESMGGAIVGQYLRRSRQADGVLAAVLDAPALDLRATLRHYVDAKHLPLSGAVTWVASRITPWRVGIELDDTQTLPVLATRPRFLFDAHGDSDALVPVAISDELKRLRPDMAYVRTHARHVESWSEDPARYRTALSGFLQQVLAAAP